MSVDTITNIVMWFSGASTVLLIGATYHKRVVKQMGEIIEDCHERERVMCNALMDAYGSRFESKMMPDSVHYY